MYLAANDIGTLWSELLVRLFHAAPASPRGLPCREFTGVTLRLHDARNNVLVNDDRNLSYRFMVAEWLYIWFGHDDVKTIAHYNKHIAKFSDNEIDFNGAYGPPVKNRWPGLVNLLREDPDTRQAVLPVYRVPSGPTKDVPCTISLQFLVRDGRLITIACMRSSDVWLGLPYDVFNFTMLGNIMAAELGVDVGSFVIHLGSSHLYDSDRNKVEYLLQNTRFDVTMSSFMRSPRLNRVPPGPLDITLRQQLDVTTLDWTYEWFIYSQVLCATTNATAKERLLVLHAAQPR